MARGKDAGGGVSASRVPGEALDPAVHGRVIHCDAPVGEHGLEVAVADRELQVPAHGPEDHLGREAEAPKRSGGGHGGYSRKGDGRSTAPTWACCPAQRNRTPGSAAEFPYSWGAVFGRNIGTLGSPYYLQL